MKNEKLFNKTVAILVKAYQNDTLQHSNCYACSVGNIIAGNLGIKLIKGRVGLYWDKLLPEWPALHVIDYYGNQRPSPIFNRKQGLQQIKATGYTPEETAKIEYAFEMVGECKSKDDRMFAGLMAVIDCLMLIHEATPTEAQEAKELFVKPVLA